MDFPLPVVISTLIKDGKILLIKRVKGSYVGLLGLPGGKIEKNEHVSEAVVREIVEESGISCSFKSHIGFISEHLVEDGVITRHFLLHVCELEPHSVSITCSTEGELGWYDLDCIEELRNSLILSDYPIIKRMILNREKNYYDCVLEKSGNTHTLKKFE